MKLERDSENYQAKTKWRTISKSNSFKLDRQLRYRFRHFIFLREGHRPQKHLSNVTNVGNVKYTDAVIRQPHLSLHSSLFGNCWQPQNEKRLINDQHQLGSME